MSDAKPRNFVVITASGRVWQGMRFTETTTYFDILDAIHIEHMTAGGSWDRPTMLLLNGAIVVEEKLADVAWNYGSALSKAVNDARADVRQKFALAPATQPGSGE